MSTLFLVRHGQASFKSDNYDQLSPLGETQARILGHHWATFSMKFDRVYVGPLQRHRQTHEAIVSAYQENGLHLPEPESLPELDEHPGVEIMKHALPKLAQEDPVIKAAIDIPETSEAEEYKRYMKTFERVMQLWVRNELNVNGFQSWASFQAQAQQALEKIMAANSGGKTVVAITSTGPIAVAVGGALNLENEQILDLSWNVRNASYAEFKFSGKRLSLSTFNAASHFQQAELLTYV